MSTRHYMKNRFYVLIVICGLFLFNCDIYALSENDIKQMREAIAETAQAYYRKGINIQYDVYRRSALYTPEDASNQNTVYSVCSSFIYNVYYNTLGIETPELTTNIFEAAKKYQNHDNIVIEFIEGEDKIYSSDGIGSSKSDNFQANIEKIMKRLSNKIEIGDFINVMYANGYGHVMLVVDFDENNEPILLESTGSSYDLNNHKDVLELKGGVISSTLRNVLYNNKTGLCYKEGTDFALTSFAIIRFINAEGEYLTYKNKGYIIEKYNDLNDSAKTRLKYKKMDISKTSNVISSNGNAGRTYANPGDTITYTIEIKNNSDNVYNNLEVVENVDKSVEIVDDGGAIKNEKILTWNIDKIDALKTKTITYTVKVPNSSKVIGKYITSSGKVNNINTHVINHYIGNSLTVDEQSALINEYNISLNDNISDMAFINKIYKNALSIDLSDLNNKSFYDIVKYNGLDEYGIYKAPLLEGIFKNMSVNNFYGIRLGRKGDKPSIIDKDSNGNITSIVLHPTNVWNFYKYDDMKDRARDIKIDDLQIGDIIYIRREIDNNLQNQAYIYLGNGVLSRGHANDSNDIVNNVDTFLNDISQDNYIIFRPAQLIIRQYSDDLDIPNTTDSIVVPNTGKSNNLLIIGFLTLMVGAIMVIKKARTI